MITMKPRINFREHPFTLKATIYHFFSSFTDALDESFFFTDTSKNKKENNLLPMASSPHTFLLMHSLQKLSY